ncbi:hypothetical protein HHK36_010226 [Tetracentron sinense]|uniref:Low temperature viability protein n=1 Tax=Tetracentron sinense TaxID=13715 RepID=A0A834ZN10_TETSI|nr:hypothetical protein HHK36_010226 [Tetracentron sinense]
MGKKKFIDKKKSATFQLFARDSSDPNYEGGPNGDRVFIRVDNNPYSINGFDEDDDDASGVDLLGSSGDTRFLDDPNSIFADAPGDSNDEDEAPRNQIWTPAAPLPDPVRREILELGLPDDGYNYLAHLREIKNTGGGSAYYHNSKAKLEQVPLDVKAYDASRVQISDADGDSVQKSIYSVASKTVGVKIQKAADPEVAALLDDSDLSRFGSDAEDLEEDFVVQANLLEGGDVIVDEKIYLVDQSEGIEREYNESDSYGPQEHGVRFDGGDESSNHLAESDDKCVHEKPRIPRLLDEQFDLLTLQEYDTDCDNDEYGSITAEDESLAKKLNHSLKVHVMDDMESDDKYKVPADFLHGDEGSNNGELLKSAADVIRRCVEYAEMYDNENQDNEVVVLQESSDESEVWDCETIVSTYSNLDNHPGKIEAPGMKRKKRLAETVSGALSASGNVIFLRGKEKLPVEFLPHNRKAVLEKEKGVASSRTDQQKSQHNQESKEEKKERKVHQESKDEKKERKAAVKEERREARRSKKEMKGLYRCEAQRAQKVAAISGPGSIPLM